ncbi:MAG: thioredoxin family protein [Planctomycetota bacterium]
MLSLARRLSRFVSPRTLAPVAAACVSMGMAQVSAVAAEGAWTEDYAAAVEQAKSEGKSLMLDFTGSDWCPPCIALSDNVLSTDAFQEWAADRLVLVTLDFPNNKPQTDAVKQQNQELSERYEVSGYPTILLTGVDGRPYFMSVGYGGQDAAEYIADLEEAHAARDALAAALSAADGLEGVAKAEVLHAGLSAMDDELVMAHYRGEVDALIAAAAQGESELDEAWNAKLNAGVLRQEMEARLSEARSAEEALAVVEDLLASQPQGEFLQELLLVKSNIVFSSGDQPKAKALLLEARAAAPESDNVEMIDRVLKDFFSDAEDAAMEHEGHDHGHEHGADGSHGEEHSAEEGSLHDAVEEAAEAVGDAVDAVEEAADDVAEEAAN